VWKMVIRVKTVCDFKFFGLNTQQEQCRLLSPPQHTGITPVHADGGGTDRGFSCGLSVVSLLQNVWSSGNTGTSDLQHTQSNHY